MDNSKKTIKILSYIFYVLAIFDLILVGLSMIILYGVNINASLLEAITDTVKGSFIGFRSYWCFIVPFQQNENLPQVLK